MVKLGGVGPGGLDSDWIPLVNWILILRVPGEESQTTNLPLVERSSKKEIPPKSTKATQCSMGWKYLLLVHVAIFHRQMFHTCIVWAMTGDLNGRSGIEEKHAPQKTKQLKPGKCCV